MDFRKISQKTSRVLITGGSGFLGGRLGNLLKEKGAEVRMTSSSTKPPFIKLNFLEEDWDSQLFEDLDAIIHCAALILGKAEYLNLVNYEGTKRLLEMAEQYKVSRFIFISSIDVLLQENDYSRTKSLAEKLVRKSGLEWTIVRPSLIFGPDNHNFNRLEKSISKLPLFPLPNRGSFLWQPVYVEDLVQIIFKVLQGEITAKEINVIGPEDLTFRQVVEIIESSQGMHKTKIPIPESLTWFLGKIGSLVSTQAQANFNSSFTSKLITDQMGPHLRCNTRLVDYYKPSDKS